MWYLLFVLSKNIFVQPKRLNSCPSEWAAASQSWPCSNWANAPHSNAAYSVYSLPSSWTRRVTWGFGGSLGVWPGRCRSWLRSWRRGRGARRWWRSRQSAASGCASCCDQPGRAIRFVGHCYVVHDSLKWFKLQNLPVSNIEKDTKWTMVLDIE